MVYHHARRTKFFKGYYTKSNIVFVFPKNNPNEKVAIIHDEYDLDNEWEEDNVTEMILNNLDANTQFHVIKQTQNALKIEKFALNFFNQQIKNWAANTSTQKGIKVFNPSNIVVATNYNKLESYLKQFGVVTSDLISTIKSNLQTGSTAKYYTEDEILSFSSSVMNAFKKTTKMYSS